MCVCVCVCVCVGGPQLVGVEQEVQLEEAVGRMVNLSCEARGHPLPSVTWNIIGSQVPSLTHSTNFNSQWCSCRVYIHKRSV